MPQVDQLILVDGGPQGPSSDDTAEIAKEIAGDKFIYLSGIYNKSGRYDRAMQMKEGLDAAEGDIIMRLSADMMIDGMDYLRYAVEEDAGVVVYDCQFIEFWLDTQHIRLDSHSNPTIRVPLAVSREAGFSVLQEGVDPTKIEERDRMFVLGTCNYHMGWIRPFEAQVRKHITHVYERKWAEHGEALMQQGERTVECWAIHHVMRYKNSAYARVDRTGFMATGLGDLDNMAYDDGLDDFKAAYEGRYGEDFFIGISRTIAPELII